MFGLRFCHVINLMALASTVVLFFSCLLLLAHAAPSPLPAAKAKQDEVSMSQTLDKMKRRDFTNEHLKLIHNLRATWANCEAGAPMVNVEKRYGSDKIHDDMARILGLPHPDKLSAEQLQHLDKLDNDVLGEVLTVYFQNAVVAPGTYQITNCMLEDNPEGKFTINVDGSGDLEFPKTETMQFKLTEDHSKLMKCMLRGLAFTIIDPKRPYGDMTYFYIDMADALGVPTVRDAEGRPTYSRDEIKRFDRLHGEMVFALQTLLQYGELKEGTFVRTTGVPWHREDLSQKSEPQPDGSDAVVEMATQGKNEAFRRMTSENANARKLMFASLIDLLKSGKASGLGDETVPLIERASSLIEAQPRNPLLYASRASYYRQSKRYNEAIADYSKAIELGKDNELAYMWLEGRALVQNTIGKETEALSDLTQAIAIKPQYLPAYYWRGRIYNSRKESAKALEDFNHVIDTNPSWNADVYYSRAVANLLLGNSLQAAKDFKFYLDNDKWRDGAAPYAVLLGYVAFRQAGKHLDAQALVATANEKLKGEGWPNVVIHYLGGKLSEEKVFSTASGQDDLTEAHWFVGAKMAYDNRIADATTHLKWVVEHGNKNLLDYELAKSSLAKLDR